MNEGICTIHGCKKPAKSRGWCRMHYTRWYRYGDPLKGEDILPAMVSGVYSITCRANGWVYIGSSGRVRSRWKTHKSWLRCGRHNIPKLQSDWDEFGENAFEFELLAEISDSEQRYQGEQVFLDVTMATGSCYNRSPSARDSTGHRFNAEQSDRLSAALAGKPKSEEHRANLWRDREVTPEFRELMRRNGEMGKGRPKSIEHRKAIVASSSAIGKSGSANHQAKLTEDRVREIKRRLADDEKGRTIAAEFGITEATVSNIKHGRSWRHIQL